MTLSSVPTVSFSDLYVERLIRRSHELLALGHARLLPEDLATREETDITGKLCDAMNAVLDGDDAPEWATVLTVIDDQPESVGDKTGKRRPRTDVCVRCINPRPEQRFRFEAKRLNNGAALRAYLGDDGMLAFIRGYYGDVPYAGMIGYVQADTCERWGDRIRDTLRAEPASYDVVEPVAFEAVGVNVPEPVFSSEHHVNAAASAKHITHTLLVCA